NKDHVIMTLTLEHDVKTEKRGQRETVWVMYIKESIFPSSYKTRRTQSSESINHQSLSYYYYYFIIRRLHYIFPFHNPYDLTEYDGLDDRGSSDSRARCWSYIRF